MSSLVPENAALVVLGPGGLALAERLKPELPGSDIHGLDGRMDGGADPGHDGVAIAV